MHVAATFIIMSAIGAAVGDPDVRCELADAAPKMMVVVFVGGLGIFFSLRWLNNGADKLRDSTAESQEALQVRKKLSLARYTLVVVFVLLAFVFVTMSLTDNACTLLQ